jgi:hypothetical protein
MKYLKKYNENQEQQDPEFAIAKIKGRFPDQSEIQDMLNDEINQWKPDEEDPEYYSRTGNGEAEDVIINHMISWFQKKYYSLSEENFEKVKQLIVKEYEFLNFNY